MSVPDSASTLNPFGKIIQKVFQWDDAEVNSNIGVLFPQGLTPADLAPGCSTAAACTQQCIRTGSVRLSHTQHAAIAAVPPTPQQPPGQAKAAAAAAAVPAQPCLTSPFAGLRADTLHKLGTSGSNAASAAAAGNVHQAAKEPEAVLQVLGHEAPLSQHQHEQVLLHQQLMMQQAQQQLVLQQIQQQHHHQRQQLPGRQQQQDKPAGAATASTTATVATLKPNRTVNSSDDGFAATSAVNGSTAAATAGAAAFAVSSARRRGRPPKEDRQNSQAYLALKQYRACKRNEVEQMETQVKAKLAQLAALQEENKILKHRHEALQSTIHIQDQTIAQLAALQLADKATAAAAAAMNNATGTWADDRAHGDNNASNILGGVLANLAAITTALTGATSSAAAAEQQVARLLTADSSLAGTLPSQRVQRGSPNQLQHAQRAQQRSVPQLLDRYKAYVAAAAQQLNQLAAALQQQQPQEFPFGSAAPPAAVAAVEPLQAAAWGVILPTMPFKLEEFLALGNDEKISPALLAINLLTGARESIEPQIWRVVASQVVLRPTQADKLTAAWQLYSASLDQMKQERVILMDRLKRALATSPDGFVTSQYSNGAAATTASDLLTNAKLLNSVLDINEYYDLSEAIDANMAREDGVMILFDYAIMCMLDEVQLAAVCVASWPCFPLMGSICAWLLGQGDSA